MFEKFRIIKSVDSEGRRVITYIKNNVHADAKAKPKAYGKDGDKPPEAVQVTVRLP